MSWHDDHSINLVIFIRLQLSAHKSFVKGSHWHQSICSWRNVPSFNTTFRATSRFHLSKMSCLYVDPTLWFSTKPNLSGITYLISYALYCIQEKENRKKNGKIFHLSETLVSWYFSLGELYNVIFLNSVFMDVVRNCTYLDNTWVTDRQWSNIIYYQTSNIRCTKSQNLNVTCLIFQLSLHNLLKSGVKWRMEDVVGAAPRGDATTTS